MPSKLITPQGGSLINLCVPAYLRQELLSKAQSLPSIRLSARSLCDLELMAIGAFSPLNQFMNQADYESVLENMRLKNGVLFPVPITLPVSQDIHLRLDASVALRGLDNEIIGLMKINEIYPWSLQTEAMSVYGTTDTYHPLVAEMHSWGTYYVSGTLEVINLPKHEEFPELFLTPREVRQRLKLFASKNIVAFQTRNPIHRGHETILNLARRQTGGVVFIHPTVGLTKPDDADDFHRVRSYQKFISISARQQNYFLSLLPLAMRFAGPKEAIWHALIRRNYGANYFIVGRDHASPGKNSQKKPFYAHYSAQEAVKKLESETGVKILTFSEIVYLPGQKKYRQINQLPKQTKFFRLSGQLLRQKLVGRKIQIPAWFMRPALARILFQPHLSPRQKGICVWITGLPGSGKSTIAKILLSQLKPFGHTLTYLDGDMVRAQLSPELGFSRQDRDKNILRTGNFAKEIVKHGGIAICAFVSPYQTTRNQVRHLFAPESFIEVYLNTPLSLCKKRDPKGLYKLARLGKIKNLTGIDDPYEPPESPELILKTSKISPRENAQKILDYLITKGLLIYDHA